MTKNIIAKNISVVAEIFGKYIGKPMKYVSIESSETSQCVVDINVIVDNITLMGPYLRLTGKDLDYKDRYVEFFMLQDFIDEKEQIKFSLPFDNFNRPPLPQTIDEYKQYKTHTIDLINLRNKRILESI